MCALKTIKAVSKDGQRGGTSTVESGQLASQVPSALRVNNLLANAVVSAFSYMQLSHAHVQLFVQLGYAIVLAKLSRQGFIDMLERLLEPGRSPAMDCNMRIGTFLFGVCLYKVLDNAVVR